MRVQPQPLHIAAIGRRHEGLARETAARLQAAGIQAESKAEDGSIRVSAGGSDPREFRSVPFRGDAGLQMLRLDVEKYRKMGYRANKSCGLHIHINALDLSPADRKALHTFGRWIEADAFKMVHPNRMTNHYCEKLKRSFNPNEAGDRYRWMNLSAWHKHRTVEFRLHHGTTLAERVYEWTKVCLAIMENGLKLGRMSRRPPGSILDMLNMSPRDRNYWTRAAKYYHGSSTEFGSPTLQITPNEDDA